MKNEDLIKHIQAHIIDSLIEDFNYSDFDALKMFEQSNFAHKLKDNLEYVLHYDIEYWATQISNKTHKKQKN